MQPESKSPQSGSQSADFENSECPNCHAMMPRQMRFCRACGYRLGEGLDEYVETVRLNPHIKAKAQAADAASKSKADPFQPQGWGAVAPHAHEQTMNGLNQATSQIGTGRKRKRGGRKLHWMVWVILAFLMLSVTGGVLTPFALRGRRGDVSSVAERSYFGVTGFRTADGGAFIDYAWPPGGPADKAGLLGGDVVIAFDGKPVKSEGDIRKLLAATPVGKTVEVTFLRDGQPRTTQLTTISKADFDRMDDAFDNKKEKGYLAEGTDIDRVIVPGMNIYGVRLNKITRSGPADMAGLKDGDIVIEFGGLPMRTRRELELRIERAEPYSTIPVVVIRDGQRMDIPVKVGVDD